MRIEKSIHLKDSKKRNNHSDKKIHDKRTIMEHKRFKKEE